MEFWIRREKRVFSREEGEMKAMVSPGCRAGGVIVFWLYIMVYSGRKQSHLDDVEILACRLTHDESSM